ncbi:MAG: prephenate dehydrogenase/arogenate dehydrogenase family protein [Zoogloeaceae bacterium]|jgi:prephenate dehydrogenase|nr:prephenate dehydrogenase/arogenate dehydrogenase family protein [Zoogloeaceae bacterium]
MPHSESILSAQKARFKKVVVFGVGLIGGSFALALKQGGGAEEIVGFGRGREGILEALRLGVIDRAGEDFAEELADADLALLATPVGQMPELFARIAPFLGERTVLTDGGSTKGDVVLAARRALGEKIVRFIPAHPLAGAENSGVAAARADLFFGKKVVITALPENDRAAVERVREAWRLTGAALWDLPPEKHDRVFAAVSHLPHFLAFTLVLDLAERQDSALFFEFAASGFRDFTRIAASHPEMWRDICLANREALLAELGAYQGQLEKLRAALEKNDGASLERCFSVARAARRKWQETRGI